MAFNWACSWAKLSFVAGLQQDADIFFLASVFIYISFAKMSGFGALKGTLLVGADVSLVVLLFGKTIFGLFATAWCVWLGTKEFFILAFYWAKTITKLNIIVKSFVNTDVIL